MSSILNPKCLKPKVVLFVCLLTVFGFVKICVCIVIYLGLGPKSKWGIYLRLVICACSLNDIHIAFLVLPCSDWDKSHEVRGRIHVVMAVLKKFWFYSIPDFEFLEMLNWYLKQFLNKSSHSYQDWSYTWP